MIFFENILSKGPFNSPVIEHFHIAASEQGAQSYVKIAVCHAMCIFFFSTYLTYNNSDLYYLGDCLSMAHITAVFCSGESS